MVRGTFVARVLQEKSEKLDYSITNPFTLFDTHETDGASRYFDIEIDFYKFHVISTTGIRRLVASCLLDFPKARYQFPVTSCSLLNIAKNTAYLSP